MSRSVCKGPFLDEKLLIACESAISAMDATAKKVVIKTRSRRSCIVPEFVGLLFQVYNGKAFIPVSVTEDMVGHKLGEFAPTRVFCVHKANK